METIETYSSDVAFTPSVKSVQVRKGSRGGYSRMEEGGSWQTAITPDLARSSKRKRASSSRPPISKDRPPGFLKVLDEKTIGFADFAGNRQYITLGNLADNPKTNLFLIDYAHRRRIKIWGEARVVEGDAALMQKLMPQDYKARPEQVILFTVAAWDSNCPQHIPQRFDADDVAAALVKREERIRALEAEVENCGRPRRRSSPADASAGAQKRRRS